jgi:predicted dehydrogenase
MNRRSFLKNTLAVSAAFPAIHGQTRGKYRTALIGSGWWGMNILREAIKSDQCQVVALCDVDENQLKPAAEEVNKLSGDKPKQYRDYRELLAKENVHIAIVATPDHWHPLCTIAAVEAGAHVYVEKPIGHTIREGRAMVSTARANKRAVQVGTHRRVSPHNISGMKFLKSGKAGKIGMIRAFVHSAGGPGQPTPNSEPPPGLDWDMWCGPAPLRPFNKAMHPRGFRQFLDYANGTLGDWGIHWMDQILWWTEEQYPRRIFSTGGRFVRQDATDAPDTQLALYEFETFRVSWEHRQYAGNNAEKTAIGCYFYGAQGTFHMGWRDGWTFYPAKDGEPVLHEDAKLGQPDDQNIAELFADLLEAIRTGRRPVCDIEIGHRSTNVSLLGMISYRLGRSVVWDGERERFIGDEEANVLLSRPYRAPWKYPEV